jgi:hypothetical protein
MQNHGKEASSFVMKSGGLPHPEIGDDGRP